MIYKNQTIKFYPQIIVMLIKHSYNMKIKLLY